MMWVLINIRSKMAMDFSWEAHQSPYRAEILGSFSFPPKPLTPPLKDKELPETGKSTANATKPSNSLSPKPETPMSV